MPVVTSVEDASSRIVETDETVQPSTTMESLASLRPVFRDDAIFWRYPDIEWRITSGSSSPLTDGGTDPDKLNPAGGAIAPGYPVGASGGRLLASLVSHLEATGGRCGLQTMCEGGGMANATVIEKL